jgi:hypothetical protein
VELKDIKVGERYAYRYSDDEVEVVDATPDCDGEICVKVHIDGGWEWRVVAPSDLSPIVRRYTVELRPPKAGEKSVSLAGKTFTAGCDYTMPYWVIVDGDQ